MAKKYKILKVMKVGSIIVGPGAATRENEEFAKVNAELVEVYDTNKNDVIAAAKDADVILLGSVPVSRWSHVPKCGLRHDRCQSRYRKQYSGGK